MRVILSMVLVVTAFLACYTTDIYFYFWPAQPQNRILITVRSPRPYNFDQEKAFGGKRKFAISQYIPIYTYLPDRLGAARRQMDDLLIKVAALQSRKPLDAAALSSYVKNEYGVEMNSAVAVQLLGYVNLRNLLEGLWTIIESSQQSKIVEDLKPIKGKKAVEIRYPDPVGTVAYAADEFETLDQARLSLQEKAHQLFWQVDKELLDPTVRIALAILQPDLRYDQRENDRRIEEITRRYPSRIVAYSAGDVMVPFHKMLTEEDVLLVQAIQEDEKKELYGRTPWTLFIIAFSVVLYNLLLTKVVAPQNRNGHPYSLLLSLLILTVVLLKAAMLFTSVSIYALPIGLLPLILILLYQERVSIACTALLVALLVTLSNGRTLDIFFFFSFGGLCAILLCPRVRKRFQVLTPSLAVGGLNVLMAGFFMLDWSLLGSWLPGTQPLGAAVTEKIFSHAMLNQIGWAFVGGLAAAPVALLLLPSIEFAWGTVSTFKLNVYTDLQHPLMKDLLVKAPGTYQHTMTVAYLAQAVGEALGANTLLLRAGAYFHDVGKTTDPRYFVENQFGGKNPHDELDPAESCEIILDHVRRGKDIAAKAGLPDIVADFIPQHHGTLLVEYFYDKALAGSGGAEVDEQDFRYPGPKPQSVEAAILMISDAVEAASRTIQEPTREKIKALVRFLIGKRISDGQLDECDLSMRDMRKIIETLTNSLEAAYHSRVEYPWQKRRQEDEPDTNPVSVPKNQ